LSTNHLIFNSTKHKNSKGGVFFLQFSTQKELATAAAIFVIFFAGKIKGGPCFTYLEFFQGGL